MYIYAYIFIYICIYIYSYICIYTYIEGLAQNCINSSTLAVTAVLYWALNMRYSKSWWRHQMETFSALLDVCAGNSLVTGEFSTQRPVTRSFDVFFDLRLNKWLSKQSWGWWFDTLSRLFDVNSTRVCPPGTQAILWHCSFWCIIRGSPNEKYSWLAFRFQQGEKVN